MMISGRFKRGALILVVPIVLAALLSACGKPAPVQSVAKAASAPALAKIVFIDEAECCNCTRTRIEASWKALGAALGDPAAFPVERIHNDTQSELAAAYTTFKPVMVIPAVYFVAADDTVVEVLQGELRADQIKAVIDRFPGH